MRKTITISLPNGLTRPRSPFTDYYRKPRGGPHATRRQSREKLLRKEVRDAIKSLF